MTVPAQAAGPGRAPLAGQGRPSAPADDLADSVAALSELVMLDAGLPATLTNIADFAVQAIPGADGAGLTLVGKNRPDTIVASAQFVRDADSLQYSIGEGPCITATEQGRTVSCGSMADDADYPRFGPRVADLGLNSMLSLPLFSDGRVLGSINVYARALHAFDERAARLGELFAAPAAISVRNAQTLDTAQHLATTLKAALVERSAQLQAEVHGRKTAEAVSSRAREEVGRATAAKNGFLSRVSHELRTPLNRILGFAQLLEQDTLSSAQQEDVQHILAGGMQLLAMIEGVFDITAADAGDLELSPEPVAIGAALSSVVELARPRAAVQDVQLRFPAGLVESDLLVAADRKALGQVLSHVLDNAIRFNRAAGRVEISCAHAGAGSLSVIISDTGRGIASGDLARLFDPFDRLGRPSGVEGSGIGLALSHRLVTAMGGRLDVDSSLGLGTTVTVTLPIAHPAAAAVQATSASPAPTRIATLLHIADDPLGVTLMAGIVKRTTGWTVVPAVSARDGLHAVGRQRPDLVMVDLRVSEPDTISLLQALLSDPWGPPLVILSSDPTPVALRGMSAEGRLQHLRKPLDVQRVVALLSATLDACRRAT